MDEADESDTLVDKRPRPRGTGPRRFIAVFAYNGSIMIPHQSKPAIRMLVVDDDAPFRDRLVRALIGRGYEARGAGSLDEALATAKQFHPSRAVVDLKMPGHGGLDVIKALADLDDKLQIVVLTGYGSIPTAMEAVRRGAMDYLNKPADAEQILAAFEKDKATQEAAAETTPSLARVEWEHMQRILHDTGGNISETARRLGIHRRSLQRKLAKFPPLE
jgi:two-component system response regulator RegA